MSNRKNPRKQAAQRLARNGNPSNRAPLPMTQVQPPAPRQAAPEPAPPPPPREVPAETTAALSNMLVPDTPQAEPEYEVQEEVRLTAIEKVKFMNSLATAAQDEELAEKFKEMEQGDLIYDLFVSAINTKLESLMGGDDQADDQFDQVYNVAEDCNYIRNTMTEFNKLVVGFMGTPLVEILNHLNTQMGGPRWAPNQQNPQLPPQQQYTNRQYNNQQPNQEDSQQPRGQGNFGIGSL